MNPSGGLLWHWRAWQSRSLWKTTCTQIEDWLLAQNINSTELVIIGASAGWMLPSLWLQHFKKITTYDIDPLAAHLFKIRHGTTLKINNCSLICHTADAMSQLSQLLNSHPKAFFWFDNVLGQLRFHTSDESDLEIVNVKINALKLIMKGKQWGSIHDLYSGQVRRQSSLHIPKAESAVIKSKSCSKKAFNNLTLLNPEGPWLDHLCEDVFNKDQLVHYFTWPYRKNYWHVLQAGWIS